MALKVPRLAFFAAGALESPTDSRRESAKYFSCSCSTDAFISLPSSTLAWAARIALGRSIFAFARIFALAKTTFAVASSAFSFSFSFFSSVADHAVVASSGKARSRFGPTNPVMPSHPRRPADRIGYSSPAPRPEQLPAFGTVVQAWAEPMSRCPLPLAFTRCFLL